MNRQSSSRDVICQSEFKPAHATRSGFTRTRKPHVTVCIVNWNCRSLLKACLRSLHPRLQGVRVQVVVVDNASTDGAADMVERCFPDVTLVRNASNVGFARANNQAAALARGRYLLFLNNDTVVPRRALRQLIRFARAHPEAGLIGPRLRDSRGRTQTSCRGKPTLSALLHRLCLFRWTGLFRKAYRRYRGREGKMANSRSSPTPREAEVLMGAALLMPRKVYRNGGMWDESFPFGGEDIDLCLRVGQEHEVLYHPEVEITHLGRVSTRLHYTFAYPHIVVGLTRCLRRGGCPGWAVTLYKCALTLDLPIQWLAHATQYIWRRLRGHHRRAEKSRLILCGLNALLCRGLVKLWKA